MIVYLTKNNINNKLYIGQTIKKDESYLGSGIAIKKAIKKYSKENFTRETLEECNSIEELNEKEEYWINFFGFPNNPSLYNIKPGGNSSLPTEETKKKMSDSAKGIKNSQYGKIGTMTGKFGKDNPNYGKKHSKETLVKKSQARKRVLKRNPDIVKGENNGFYGRKHSEETKKKISKEKKGKYNGKNNPNYKDIDTFLLFKMKMNNMSFSKIGNFFNINHLTAKSKFYKSIKGVI